MKKFLPNIKTCILGLSLFGFGINAKAQNFCAAGISINPNSIQNICVGSPATPLIATITTSGSGAEGNITYNWYQNSTNSTSAGTLVQTLSTTTSTLSNSFTPPATAAGQLWYYCTVTNDGGVCDGSNFTTTSAVQITVNSLPTLFNVSGGGVRCSNGPVLGISLSGSTVGVNYQLRRGSLPVGTILPGNGRSLVFGLGTAGAYTIIASNASSGCSSVMNGSATITVNPAPGASFTKTDVSCQGADGSITAVGNGGTPAYLFNIDGGAFASNNVFNGLSVGNHTIAVKDANACTTTLPGISIQNAAPLSVSISRVDPGDCSGTSGSITALRSGGVDDGIIPVEYELDGDATRPYQTNNVFSGLSKGNYTVTIKDSKGCTAISSVVTLTQEAGTIPALFNVTGGGPRCSNGPGIGLFLSGSELNVNYQLQRGGIPVGSVLPGTGNMISFLINIAGSYTVVATNVSAGCTTIMNGVATVTVNNAPAGFTVAGGGTRCNNAPGLGITLSSSETGINYQLLREGLPIGTVLPGTGQGLSFTGTNAGTFTMMATNATTGCTNLMNGSSVIVVNTAPTAFQVSGGGAKCGESSSLAIKLGNSETGVNYQLNRGGNPVGTSLAGTGSAINFLGSSIGTYKMLATNPNTGCTNFMSDSAIISQNPALTPTFTKYFASSCVGGDGTITVTGNGGTPAYTYSVDDGPFTTNNFLTGLAAGDHKVVVKDANSCTFTYAGITVLTAPIMKVNSVRINPSYCAGNDGSIAGFAYGGVGDGITPLEYKLDGDASRPFQLSNLFSDLSAGNYVVTIKDSKGCLAQSTVLTLTGSAPLVFKTASYNTDVSNCGNGSDAMIAFGVTGGVAPFHYLLNGVEDGVSQVPNWSFKNLGAGTYSVSVVDFHGCTVSKDFTVGTASAPLARVTYRGNETCIGANDGYISLSPSNIGGVPLKYEYSDDGGLTFQTSPGFLHLSPGNYSMIVRDFKQCQSAPVVVTIKAGTVNCFAGRTAQENSNANRTGKVNEKIATQQLLSSKLAIKAYPNPFVSEISLDIQGNSVEKVLITVTDILGRKLYQAQGNANQQYKLGSTLDKGTYFVQVIQGDQVQTIKAVKAR